MRKALIVLPVLLLFFVSFVSALVIERPNGDVEIVENSFWGLFSMTADQCEDRTQNRCYFRTSTTPPSYHYLDNCALSSTGSCRCNTVKFDNIDDCVAGLGKPEYSDCYEKTGTCTTATVQDGSDRYTIRSQCWIGDLGNCVCAVQATSVATLAECEQKAGRTVQEGETWCLVVDPDVYTGSCQALSGCDGLPYNDVEYPSENDCKSILGDRVFCLKADKSACYQSGNGVCASGEVRFEDQHMTINYVRSKCDSEVVVGGTTTTTSSSSGGTTTSGDDGTTSSSGGSTTTSGDSCDFSCWKQKGLDLKDTDPLIFWGVIGFLALIVFSIIFK